MQFFKNIITSGAFKDFIKLILSIIVVAGIFILMYNILQSKYNQPQEVHVQKIDNIVHDGINISEYDINKHIEVFLMNETKAMRVLKEINKGILNMRITESIITNSINNNVPISLSMAIAWNESRFMSRAVNNFGNKNGTQDYGLYQINDVNIPSDWTIEDKLNIEKNVALGIDILSELLYIYDGDTILVIAAYNAGQTGILDGISYSTLLYIKGVLSYKQRFEEIIIQYINNVTYNR